MLAGVYPDPRSSAAETSSQDGCVATPLTDLSDKVRSAFRSRVSGDPTGAPDWVRAIATVGEGPGLFEPDGVVWRVHGDLSTLAGGVAALLGQAAHPLALAGVQGHSDYTQDPWKRLAGTARWLVVTTFGSEKLAERESARVRGMHRKVQGHAPDGRAYAAGDPDLLRWVHLAFTDAFLAGQLAVGTDLAPRFGPNWPDSYVSQWAVSAAKLGATDLPTTHAELGEAIAAYRDILEPVPEELRSFLAGPPGLGRTERLGYRGLAGGSGLLVSPIMAPLASVGGRNARGPREKARLLTTKGLLRTLAKAVGPTSPSEEAARWRIGIGPTPFWMDSDADQ